MSHGCAPARRKVSPVFGGWRWVRRNPSPTRTERRGCGHLSHSTHVEDSIPMARKDLFNAIPPNRWKAIALSAVRVAIGLGFMWWLYSLVPKDVDERIFIPGVLLLVGLAVYVWFVKKEIERILGSRYPEVLAVEGLILSAALFMVIFASIYLVIDGLNPGSFTEPLTHLSSHYLTLTILSTVGFGDITAVTDQARLAVMIQMALTLGFLAVTIRVFSWATKRALVRRHGPDTSTQHN
ncbi:MAG TPA: hypothetical protein DDW61_02200 [Actinobacteria bacterium]|nr:hypothetical protein [Actinomycetota bacterium]